MLNLDASPFGYLRKFNDQSFELYDEFEVVTIRGKQRLEQGKKEAKKDYQFIRVVSDSSHCYKAIYVFGEKDPS